MMEPVNELLNAFDALSDAERHVAAAEVLRRVLQESPAMFGKMH